MGDRHPHTLFADMQRLVPPSGNTLLNAMFLQRLPERIRVALTDRSHLPPAELAEAAALSPLSPPCWRRLRPSASPSNPLLQKLSHHLQPLWQLPLPGTATEEGGRGDLRRGGHPRRFAEAGAPGRHRRPAVFAGTITTSGDEPRRAHRPAPGSRETCSGPGGHHRCHVADRGHPHLPQGQEGHGGHGSCHQSAPLLFTT